MIKIILVGSSGKMGTTVSDLLRENNEIKIVAGIDKLEKDSSEYPVFDTISKCNINADVILDFSNSAITDDVVDYSSKKKIPLVLCTTGLSNEQVDNVKKASKKTPILKSANMSVGINIISKVLEDISLRLKDEGFDIEIIEKHHNLKKDSPSGTALFLADSINNSLDKNMIYTFDRSDRNEKRLKNEIGISSVRGGTIPGDHEIIFAGLDETISISHRAYSKKLFAIGAIKACKFIYDKEPGLYSMKDVFK